MPLPDPTQVYPRSNDSATVYLKNVVSNPSIEVGDFTIYNDSRQDPREFEKNNVLYHYPVNRDRVIIGKFCSIACGARFLMNSANHALGSLSTYPFPIFGEQWDPAIDVRLAWDNRGDIVVGNDVWIGYEALILAGVRIGDGAIVASRSVVTRDVPPYAIVGGIPARVIRYRFPEGDVSVLMKLKWWDWPVERIAAHLRHIQSGNLAALQAQAIGAKS